MAADRLRTALSQEYQKTRYDIHPKIGFVNTCRRKRADASAMLGMSKGYMSRTWEFNGCLASDPVEIRGITTKTQAVKNNAAEAVLSSGVKPDAIWGRGAINRKNADQAIGKRSVVPGFLDFFLNQPSHSLEGNLSLSAWKSVFSGPTGFQFESNSSHLSRSSPMILWEAWRVLNSITHRSTSE